MKKLVLVSMLVFSQFVFATVGPALIELIPQSAFPSLEARIKSSVQQQTGIRSLKGFKVQWNYVKECIEAKNEMLEPIYV